MISLVFGLELVEARYESYIISVQHNSDVIKPHRTWPIDTFLLHSQSNDSTLFSKLSHFKAFHFVFQSVVLAIYQLLWS